MKQTDSQSDRIEAELLAHKGEFIPMRRLVELSGSYNIHSRVADLRRRGHTVENRLTKHDGRTRSYYRIPSPAQAELAL